MGTSPQPTVSQQLEEYFALKDRNYVPLRDATIAKAVEEEEKARDAGKDPVPVFDPSIETSEPSYASGPQNKLKDSKLNRFPDPIPPYRSILFPKADDSFGKLDLGDLPQILREQQDSFKERSPGQVFAEMKEQGLKSKDKKEVEAWKTVERVTSGPGKPDPVDKGKGKAVQGKKGGKK